MTGYWDLSISSPWEYVWYNGTGTDWSLGTAPSGTDFAVDVDNDPYSAIVYECKVPLSDLDSEGNFSDDGEIIGFAFRSTDAIDSSTGNYSSSASNTDTSTWGDLIYQSVVIPEFFEIGMPVVGMMAIFIIIRRKKRKLTSNTFH